MDKEQIRNGLLLLLLGSGFTWALFQVGFLEVYMLSLLICTIYLAFGTLEHITTPRKDDVFLLWLLVLQFIPVLNAAMILGVISMLVGDHIDDVIEKRDND